MEKQVLVQKRSGAVEPYNPAKVELAVKKAQASIGHVNNYLPMEIEEAVWRRVQDSAVVSVEFVHEEVENQLMVLNQFAVAREYISYRSSHKPDIFKERIAYRPFEYPQLYKFVEAIQESYWTFKHFNYNSSVQDFKVTLTDHERIAATRSMLAIGQIEVAVKTFWGKIGDILKKPEIQAVGATFSESEVRHADAYTQLLELLGLNEEFNKIDEYPVLKARRDYLRKSLNKDDDKDDFVLKVLLFSTFVENVSLFSQFLVMMSFNKERNQLAGLSNAIEATSKEEDLHFQFGMELVKIMKKENPKLFTDELISQVIASANESVEAECNLVDWIFDDKDLPFLTIADTKAFIYKRMQKSLALIDIDFKIPVEYKPIGNFDWFDQELLLPSNPDFFNKKSTAYSKNNRSYDEQELF